MLELSRELIGAVALGFFWIHTLLVAAAAGIDLRALGRLGRGRVRAGIVRAGRGPGGALARHVTDQIGRSKGDAIVHFNDSAHRSELFGGVVALDDGTELELEPIADVAVWPDRERQRIAAVSTDAAVVERALVEARRAKGWARAVEVTLAPEQRVWVVEREGAPVVVAAVDPSRWLSKQRLLLIGFMLATLALGGVCTVLMLWPPVFGTISMIGALAALGFFLGVQPLGVTVQDAVRTPDRAYLRGRWG